LHVSDIEPPDVATLHAPVQVMLHEPPVQVTWLAAPTVAVHDLPAHVT
jgi:hypothetical protein